MLNQLVNILIAEKRSIMPTKEQLEVAEIRLNTCLHINNGLPCEHYSETEKPKCSKCGCKLGRKIFTPEEGASACPLQKWSFTMPYSYGLYKNEFAEHLKQLLPNQRHILDVGAGSGAYADLLRPHFENMDAIEIFAPYIDMFKLKDKYKNVFNESILDFDISGYDYLIMGDVIEHLTFLQAKNLIEKICSMEISCMIAVPYLFEQGEEYGNAFETHLQPDLTHELFLERYPQMNLLWKDDKYGYYTNY